MNKWLPLVATLPLIAGCQAWPDIRSPLATSTFNGYDTDGDGVISQQEAEDAPRLARNFQRIDTNNSGGIDPSEYAAASAYISDLQFAQVDINGDGVISEREADAMPDSLKQVFGTVDTDGDGNVSRAEYRAASVNLMEGFEFGRLDRDNDGVIGSAEAARVPELSDSFGRIDTDGDNLISPQEFAAAQRPAAPQTSRTQTSQTGQTSRSGQQTGQVSPTEQTGQTEQAAETSGMDQSTEPMDQGSETAQTESSAQ